MPEWPTEHQTTITEMSEQLRQEQESNLLLQESLADLELSLEDRSWIRFEAWGAQEFSREGLRQAAAICRLMALANPLIRRGLSLRTAYVWGQGVSITARATGDNEGEQDVNTIVQGFLDDESNRTALTSGQARERHERSVGTDGNVFLACFTSPVTGRVQTRTVPFDEITEIICNPDDKSEHWFYLRRWTSTRIDPYTGGRSQVGSEVFYPALGYRPRVRPKMVDDVEVWWDAPVLHISVNGLEGWQYGIGDAYSAVAWGRMYQEFLTDWAKLVKALSRFAWRLTGDKSSKTRTAAAKIRATQPATVSDPDAPTGALAAYGPGVNLEAIPKSGATIDSESGRPLAAMVAAALGVPVTMLLTDPGVTGARATAQTLDLPTELEMGLRRTLWGDVYRRLLSYVVDQAVKAPRGPLQGTVVWDRDSGREVITLAGDTDRTVEVTWPDLSDTPVETLVKAITEADSTGRMPPRETMRLLLQALGVKDVDELLDEFTDENGEFIDPASAAAASAGDAAVQAFRRGENPVEALR
jgi:ribosomal protein L12E/L44/L45/RPP1/RPP2